MCKGPEVGVSVVGQGSKPPVLLVCKMQGKEQGVRLPRSDHEGP